MRKIFIFALALTSFASTAFAGGLATNTNQNIAFLRNPARGNSTEIDAVYSNPAGVGFLANDGFHFSFNVQGAMQTRTSATTYAPFAYNGGNPTKEYVGKAMAAVPSFQFAYKQDWWSAMASFGIGGGGGTAHYDKGLGSFESMVAVLPAALNQNLGAMGFNTSAYSLDCAMQGTQITYAGTIGAAFRVTKWLSLAAQVRYNHVTAGYNGHIRNIQTNLSNPAMGINPTGAMMPAYQTFLGLQQATGNAAFGALAAQVADKKVDCEQTGYGITPVVGIHFEHSGWNLGAKYEFRTKVEMTNATKVDDTGMFPDGVKSRNDIPAFLSVAAGKLICDKVRISLEWHHFFDKDANMEGKEAFIKHNTNEYIAGVEWYIGKRWTVSSGVQRTQYDLENGFLSDMNFPISATSWGIGGAFKILDNLKLNVAYLGTFYDKRKVVSAADAYGLKTTNNYSRTSHAIGVGLDWNFGLRKK
jgi:hypothetical protein